MFLNKKRLIIHNQERVKNHILVIKNELLKEVEMVVNNEDLTLEQQQVDNLEILRKSMKNVLLKNLKIWNNESI